MSDLVHNERTKLLANALDRASTAALAIGVLGPVVSAAYELTPMAVPLPGLIVGTILWMSMAAGLHFLARLVLRRLR